VGVLFQHKPRLQLKEKLKKIREIGSICMRKNLNRRLKMMTLLLTISFGLITYKNDRKTSVSNTMNFTEKLALVPNKK